MKLSVRQVCLIMFLYTAVSKVLLYPTVLAGAAGRDLLFPALINFGVQGVIVWALAFLCSRTDKTFYGLLSDNIGKTGAKVVYGFFAAFFMFATLVPLFEQKTYVQSIFYDTIPSVVAFLPFFVFSTYVAGKRFTNIGRCADVCLPIFLIAFLFIFGMSFVELKWESFMPVLQTPAKNIFGGALSTVFRFVEPCYLLMFMGHFKYKKGDAAKITISYAAGALVVMLVLVIFYGVYGEIAQSREFAISQISLFFPAIDSLGRIDLIALYFLETVMLFGLTLNIQLAVHCLIKCTGYDNRAVFSLAVNAVLFTLTLVFNNSLGGMIKFYSQWGWIVFIIFANLIPLLSWALKRRAK